MAQSYYVSPLPSGSWETYDQGIDIKGKPGDSVVAIGRALVIRVSEDAGGFGKAVYYKLLDGPFAGRVIYVGHADPSVLTGQVVQAGQPVARLLQVPLGNAGGDPGHTEIGFATATGSGPAYSSLDHGASQPGGSAFARWLASIGLVNPSEFGPQNVTNGVVVTSKPPPPPSGGGDTGSAVAGAICKVECCWLPLIGEACPFSPLCISCKAAAGAAGVPGQGTAGSIGSGIAGALGSAGSILDFLKALTDPAFWLRIGEVLAGTLVTLAGLVIIMRHIGLTPPSVPVPVPSV